MSTEPPSVICNFEPISQNGMKKKKKKNRNKFSDQSVDAILRVSNTLPNTTANIINKTAILETLEKSQKHNHAGTLCY